MVLGFEQFMSGDYEEEEHNDLYVLRNEEGVLYVGISRNDIWDRWFSGWGSHMIRTIYGEWYPNSSVGEAVVTNMPASLKWTIELWTREDCAAFLGVDPTPYNMLSRNLEAKMINRLHASLNITCSIGEITFQEVPPERQIPE